MWGMGSWNRNHSKSEPDGKAEFSRPLAKQKGVPFRAASLKLGSHEEHYGKHGDALTSVMAEQTLNCLHGS